MLKGREKIRRYARRAWEFFWQGDSIGSWIANIVAAFLVIYFVVYPLLGLLLGTSFPIVAVLSESMQHNLFKGSICGEMREEWRDSFNNYWDVCGRWYEKNGITKEQFKEFRLGDGFNKGDVIILWRGDEAGVGDILVFEGARPQPIIHRVVRVWEEDGNKYYQTKGDHNSESIKGALGETKITSERVLGKGVVRLPYLGWVKILFVDLMSLFGVQITR